MSRGLGRMQRAVLASIAAYRFPGAHWRGGEVVPSGRTWCLSRGIEFELPEDTIDARGVSRFLSRGRRGHGNEILPATSASVSRAFAGLVRRGILTPVPSSSRFYRLSDKPLRLTLTDSVLDADDAEVPDA